ncbi:two component response regulator with GGDEF domain protein [Legionella maceachernii]|uniref:diguanylate cyclase n=1 Tax=Legionella maceachernii TaxID=466 RepID=A0A0W0WCI8_9GAMM|nr:two component response regulator with GGDEF domain protein [Legionella maceachernii]SKA30991.1 diguanylate cyclase (GGDEF) domain-containing protein [Legionella maceachernii]SUP04206.1 Bacteriophytochrome cph2 [Legionella maceachernii]
MKWLRQEVLHSESYQLLLDNSLRSIPFNVLIAGLLSFDLFFQKVPRSLILLWFLSIVLVSTLRWIYSKHVLNREDYRSNNGVSVLIFLVLTLLMGLTWGASYALFLPYISVIHETIIILIFGGMSAGAAASLAPYLPAYYAYLLPMFIPVILYNYAVLNLDRAILATMFLLFVIMVATAAKLNNKLINKVFQLSGQKDSLIKQLSFSNKKLEVSNEEIRILSITDPLTGLYNRRYFDNCLQREIQRAKRNKYPLSLILIDIDNFKFINDTYGHPYGDEYLILIATVLKKMIRRTNDILVRLGGDEFAAILANMDMDEIRDFCEKIRLEFSKVNPHKNITLSIGIICIKPSNKDETKRILALLDKLLYQAKERGKNNTISQTI